MLPSTDTVVNEKLTPLSVREPCTMRAQSPCRIQWGHRCRPEQLRSSREELRALAARLQQTPERLILEVADDGVGIPKDRLEGRTSPLPAAKS